MQQLFYFFIQIIMTSIFILQLICCTITGMLGLHIAMASLQVRWKERRYETSRWLLCGSMAVFCIHYFLQMTQGFRAQGADVGAVVNIMFYTPVVFAITPIHHQYGEHKKRHASLLFA